MRSKRIPGWAQVLGTAAAALAFLLVYELAVYRVPLQQIFLPCSYWSDEVIYSKQLAAVVRCGAPQGYFGFNESHAASGTFAAWGPAVFFCLRAAGFIPARAECFFVVQSAVCGRRVDLFRAGCTAERQAAGSLCCRAGRLQRTDTLCVLRHAGAASLCTCTGGAGLWYSGTAG